MARANLGYLPRGNPCAQCGKPISSPDWIEQGRGAYPISGPAVPATTGSRRSRSSMSGEANPGTARGLTGTRLPPSALVLLINPCREGENVRRHDQTTPVDCERSRRGHVRAPAERRQDRPHREADDRQGHRAGVLRDPQLSAASSAWAAICCRCPGASCTTIRKFEAYELDIDNDELKRAPSFHADKDFDWGDRSQEIELHRYYGVPPYWGGF